ncbi:hypothetical protein ACS5PN_13785 [Roseateles sp. NT4]|uniref:hypothetical protein n=1 Tax=Roseateles sp. NT4 TaxID=3453715 RepID=UPI003EEF786C
MTVKGVCVGLIGFIAAVASSGPVLAAEPRLEQPDFTLEIQLDAKASQFLKAHQEWVGLSISFADVVGPGGANLASFRRAEKDSFSMRVKDVSFDPVQVKRLRTLDYEVLVNVYSDHRHLDGNVLDCDLLQAPISQLQRRVHTIQCRLGDWASQVKPKRRVSPSQTSSTSPDSPASPPPHSAASR